VKGFDKRTRASGDVIITIETPIPREQTLTIYRIWLPLSET